MSVLARVSLNSQQRFDLSSFLSMESFQAFDFRALISSLVGSQPYIVRGFEIVGKTGLSISVTVADAFVFNPNDSAASFYYGNPNDPEMQLDLEPSQPNVYVEAKFVLESRAPTTAAFWNPLASTGNSTDGAQFAATQDSQIVVQLEISANTIGFNADSIPLFIITTAASAITKIVDARPLFFRLGTGGVNPNPFNKYGFSPNREEPPFAGTGVGNEPGSPFWSNDINGVKNDKGIRSLKEAFDAIVTRISEVSGSPLWYTNSLAQQYVSGLNLNTVFFDSPGGHSIQPSKNTSLKFSRFDLGTVPLTQVQWQPGVASIKVRIFAPSTTGLFVGNQVVIAGFGNAVNNGTFSITAVTATYFEIQNPLVTSSANDETTAATLTGIYTTFGVEGTEPVAWRSNYQNITWRLGKTFTLSSVRTYADSKASVNVPDGSNVYLLLEREGVKGSGNPVAWKDNSAFPAYSITRAVSGLAGDFTGVAISDYIRKESEGISRYYRVVALSDGTSSFTENSNPNKIADATIVSVLLSSEIVGPVSTEVFRFFRANYSEADLKVDPYNSYSFADINYYWIGRRSGDLFILRDYGILQAGEEANTLEDSFNGGGSFAGANELMLEHGFAASMIAGQYKKNLTSPDPLQPLLTLRRRKSDNTVSFLGPISNAGAMMEYSIAHSVVLTMAAGDSLWCRLSDTTSAVLSAGAVINTADDQNNTDVNTNRYEVRSAANTPLRTFDNKNVFQIAKCVTLADGATGLIFIDGTVLSVGGYHINNNVLVRGALTVEGGQNIFRRYYNGTGSTISSGTAVHLVSALGEIAPCSAITMVASDGFIGFSAENIAPATFGLVQIFGEATVNVTGGPLLVGKAAYLSTTYGTVSPTVPVTTGNAMWVAGYAIATNKILIGIDFRFSIDNVYEEPLTIVTGSPANDNEATGPVSPSSTLLLPFDSRDGNTTQFYLVGSGRLSVYLNGQFLNRGDDYAEVGASGSLSNQIQILQSLVIGDLLEFRIDLGQNHTIVTTGGGGGGGGTLQDAYAAGRFISTTAANPVNVSGTGVVLYVTADLQVDGLII